MCACTHACTRVCVCACKPMTHLRILVMRSSCANEMGSVSRRVRATGAGTESCVCLYACFHTRVCVYQHEPICRYPLHHSRVNEVETPHLKECVPAESVPVTVLWVLSSALQMGTRTKSCTHELAAAPAREQHTGGELKRLQPTSATKPKL